MPFDEFWEKMHASRQWGKYPNEMFVRFMLGNYKNVPDRSQIKVLEIGCGGGANIWFVGKEGFSAFAFDASPSAIENTKKFLSEEKIPAHLEVADAENLEDLFPGEQFDVIFDICTLCHMKFAESTPIVDKLIHRLKPGGRYFSIAFAKGLWGDGQGQEIAKNCYSNIPDGPLQGIGVVQLMALENMQEWAAKFSNSNIEEISYTMNSREKLVKYFLLTAQK